MSTRTWRLNLKEQVKGVLPMRFGGLGNTRGYAVAVVQPFTNGTAGTLAIGTIVRCVAAGSAGFVDSRVEAAPTENGTDVLGVVVGSYEGGDQTTFVATAPAAGRPVAVMTSGIADVLISSAVTRGHYAFVSSTAGQAKSSATSNPGAFGRVIQSNPLGVGDPLTARVALGLHGTGNAYATPNLTLGTANAAGSASSTIRSDATIAAFDTTAPTTATFGATAATGSAAKAARRDHAHGMPANPTTGTMDGNARVAVRNNGAAVGTRRAINFIPGTNVTFTAADDAGNEEVDLTINAAGGGGTPGTGTTTSAVGDSTDHGASTDYSRTDHRHGRESFGTVTAQTSFGASSGSGAATTVSRSDHTHGTPADPVPGHEAAADPHPGYILESIVDAKGDLITATADNTPARLAVGADETILAADSTTATGLAWIENFTEDLRLRAKNATGSTLAKGTVVYISGASGGTAEISLADASTDPLSARTIGIARESIAINAVGYVTVAGIIKGIDTTAYTDGENLWLSTTAGQFTDTRPTAPDHAVHVAYVVKGGVSNGEIYVYVQNGFEVAELHDVLLTTLTTGDILIWNGTLWVNTARFDATAPTTGTFGASAATGSATTSARRDHVHGLPADPVPAHVAASDPHTGYLQETVVSGLGTPSLTLGTSNAAGTGTTVVGTGATIAAFDATAPTTAAFGASAATGSAAFAARRDHAHGMPADPVPGHVAASDPHTEYLQESVVSGLGTPSLTLGTTNAAGTGTTVIGTGATIAAFDATSPTTIAFGDAAAAGSAAFAARRDHTHGAPANPVSFATPSIALGTAASSGSASTVIRSDATIAAFDATAPSTASFGDSPATGAASVAARRDHSHGMPADPVTAHVAASDPHTGYLQETVISGLGTPALTLGTTNAAGTGTTVVGAGATIAAFDATAPSTIAFGASAATGSAGFAARRDHAHGAPADPVPGHVAAADPHTGYVLETTSATQTVLTSSTSATPLIVKGASGQTADIFIVQNNAATELFAVEADGTVRVAGDIVKTESQVVISSPFFAGNIIQAGQASIIPVTVRGATAQSADIFVVDDVSGTDYFSVSGSGVVKIGTNTVPVVTATAPSIVLGSAASAGTSTTALRADATIAAFDATVPAAWAYGQTGATGSAAFAARRDHVHETPANPILDSESSNITVTNSTVETTFLSFSVPANTLGSSRSIRGVVRGTYLNNTGGNRTFSWNIKFGATTLVTGTTAAVATSTATRAFVLNFNIAANNATNAQTVGGTLSLSAPDNAANGIAANTTNLFTSTFSGTSAIDQTSAQTLAVTFQHGSAVANLTLVRQYASLVHE